MVITMARIYEFYGMDTTVHYNSDRQARENLISQIGIGELVDSFSVNKGHENGLEIHQISSTGLILIFNKRTHKLVTKLIARPEQIIRYYSECNIPVNYNLLKLAMEHEQKGYNKI